MTASTFRFEGPSIEQTTVEAALSPFRAAALRHGNLTTTVPRELVHRAAVAEVMLTDWKRLADAHFAMTAQWPRGHSFFTPVDGVHHDPLIAAETIRQIGALLAHAEFGVPFGHQFLLEELTLTVHPEQLRIGQTPAALDIDVTCKEVRKRAGRLTGLAYETTVLREGRPAASGRISFSAIAPAVYRRLRPERVFSAGHRPIPLTAPVAPQSVGRLSPADVVLSPTGDPNRWQLRVDTRHPVLFDHQVDHVPGMVLLEAARQAATAVLGRSSILPLGLECEFKKYAELDLPCLIDGLRLPKAAPGDPDTVLVTGHQDGEPVFSTMVTAALGD
ncbi:ScbA/BarX family gamma-butyrolactone biosynthesis protein [Streptomyces jeddahensis]|uniref:A-factor biosynthesis hotdog domain protein n=1 Tax=Streptomyces jeddahensis TaxID=1716141 RepID=A0A177HJG5_9ACTN|nr:ScbA/BarX family gamma-butyrolactone biosynthesis protein [Streptomyces jeddahensis]OAH10886.1 A-factor biosynthesis hotdog domain protein [Streptomyces jeddahensis]